MAMGRCFTAPLNNFRWEARRLLEAVKMALRITTDAFDAQLNSLIAAAQLDLGVAGVVVPTDIDALVQMAVITYCRLHFGQPDDYDRLKKRSWQRVRATQIG